MTTNLNQHIPIISRDAFCLLNSSTYYSLYPDIFYHHVMQSCALDHFGMNYALYNKVQINKDYRIEDKEENNFSHEHINFYSHQLSVGKSRYDLKESQIASSIDSSQFVFRVNFSMINYLRLKSIIREILLPMMIIQKCWSFHLVHLK